MPLAETCGIGQCSSKTFSGLQSTATVRSRSYLREIAYQEIETDMSTNQDTAEALPKPLPRDIVLALSRWQTLRRSGWELLEASATLEGLLGAGELALQSGREALSRALDAFSLYLSFLVDSGAVEPNASQLHSLGKLEEAVLALLRAERSERAPDAAPDERKAILLLVPQVQFWQTIIERLQSGAFRVEHCTRVDELLRKLDSLVPAAVLIDEDHLGDLTQIASRLEGMHVAGTLGATVLYFNRQRDTRARNQALADGADGSLEGEDVDYLVTRVSELINVRERQENLRVLIVEDDRSQALYCELVLRKQGIDVRVAADSKLAMAAIREFLPDLVLMDLHMPDVDGMQLTELIRDEPDLALLPIVFVTGEQDEGTRFNALRAGGDDYIVKPIRPRHLVTAVVSRARRARKLRLQFATRPSDFRQPRLLQSGEFITLLRSLGVEQPCHHALLMCAPDQGRILGSNAHTTIELEAQHQIARHIEHELADDERVAPWPGGAFLILLGKPSDHDLMSRARTIRQQINEAMHTAGGSDVSLAVITLPTEALPSAESLLDLAERTLDVARHAGGKRVKRALTEAQPDLPADISLALEKALSVAPSPSTLSLLYQPIVPLHGAPRPQYHLHLGVPVGARGERRITRLQWRALARHMGCSIGLDQYAVRHALDCIKEQRKSLPGLRIFVAVDATSIADPAFLEALLSGLIERGLEDPGLVLCIDHSEAMFLQNKIERARRQLELARVLLCFGRVGVDAKGGDVIDSLKPEILAVDATALRASSQTPAILSFARESGAELVAHFIPDANTLARLFALGVDYGMGNFVGTPREKLDYDFGDSQG